MLRQVAATITARKENLPGPWRAEVGQAFEGGGEANQSWGFLPLMLRLKRARGVYGESLCRFNWAAVYCRAMGECEALSSGADSRDYSI